MHLLSETNQSGNLLYHVILTQWHSREGKTIETLKRSSIYDNRMHFKQITIW